MEHIFGKVNEGDEIKNIGHISGKVNESDKIKKLLTYFDKNLMRAVKKTSKKNIAGKIFFVSQN